MSTTDIIRDKDEQIVEIEKQLAVKRAKIDELNTWAENLREQAETSARQAGELRQRVDELEAELDRVKSSPANAWEDAQMKLDVMWGELDGKLEELVTQVRNSRFD